MCSLQRAFHSVMEAENRMGQALSTSSVAGNMASHGSIDNGTLIGKDPRYASSSSIDPIESGLWTKSMDGGLSIDQVYKPGL